MKKNNYKNFIIDGNFKEIINLFDKKINLLSEKSSVFVLYQTEYDNSGNVVHDFLDIINAVTRRGLFYVNTIVYPTKKAQSVCFNDNVKYCIWFCLNKQKMIFNKNQIREKHIWKNVEWGHRKKNYNRLGKDPGNVWIPTIDDGEGHITRHILLDEKQIIKRIKLMSEDRTGETALFKSFRALKKIKKSKSTTKKTKINPKQYKIFFKSSEDMCQVNNGSISSVITSPPYWDLKNYFKKGQIGQETYTTYIKRLWNVFHQCYLKLNKNGSLWVNINIRVKEGRLILIPDDIKKVCKQIGFFYKGIFIWHKSSAIPTNSKNLKDHHEFILLFSKKNNFEIDWSENAKNKDYKNDYINEGGFWNLNRKAGSISKKTIHPAIFPLMLSNRAILLSTKENDLVMDPFLGSGTTLISAIKLNRGCISFEFNNLFKDLIKNRIISETVLPVEKVKFK